MKLITIRTIEEPDHPHPRRIALEELPRKGDTLRFDDYWQAVEEGKPAVSWYVEEVAWNLEAGGDNWIVERHRSSKDVETVEAPEPVVGPPSNFTPGRERHVYGGYFETVTLVVSKMEERCKSTR